MLIPKNDAASSDSKGRRFIPCCNQQVEVLNQTSLDGFRKFAASIKPPIDSADSGENANLKKVLKSREWFKTFSRIQCRFSAADRVGRSQEALLKSPAGVVLNTDATALYGDTTLIHYEALVNYYDGLTPEPPKQILTKVPAKIYADGNTDFDRFIAMRITPLSREGYFRMEIGTIGGATSKGSKLAVDASMEAKMVPSGIELTSRYRLRALCIPGRVIDAKSPPAAS